MAKEKENLIQEGEYKKFCKDNSDNILCSDFVKDVIFPELVDVNLWNSVIEMFINKITK